jgi:hypothetical protein
MDRIAYSLSEAARVAGVSRTRIFDAVRRRELTVRKAGRSTIVTRDELLVWINSLPVKGKPANIEDQIDAKFAQSQKGND